MEQRGLWEQGVVWGDFGIQMERFWGAARNFWDCREVLGMVEMFGGDRLRLEVKGMFWDAVRGFWGAVRKFWGGMRGFWEDREVLWVLGWIGGDGNGLGLPRGAFGVQ